MKWHIHTPSGRYLGVIEPRAEWFKYMVNNHGRLSLAAPAPLRPLRMERGDDAVFSIDMNRVDFELDDSPRQMIEGQSRNYTLLSPMVPST